MTTPQTCSALSEKIRAHLELRRDQLCREIDGYPPPRPACDVHFNRLLEERSLVFQELARLDALLGANLSREELAARLGEFGSASAGEEKELTAKAAKKVKNRN